MIIFRQKEFGNNANKQANRDFIINQGLKDLKASKRLEKLKNSEEPGFFEFGKKEKPVTALTVNTKKSIGSKTADFIKNNKKALIAGSAGTAAIAGGSILLHRHNKKKKEEEENFKNS